MTTLIPRSLIPQNIFHLQDIKGDDIDPASIAQRVWTTRDLVETSNDITGASVAANIITLPKGIYWVDGNAIGYEQGTFQCRLRNITDGVTELIGGQVHSSTSNSVAANSLIKGKITVSATKTFSMQHWQESAGLIGDEFTTSGENSIWADLVFFKIG